MNEPLDEQYLTWLYSQVGAVKLKTQSRTHWDLLRHLYKKEFKWFVANDDNRCEDGSSSTHERSTKTTWIPSGCTCHVPCSRC
jgi:hypothetical protein